MDVFFFVDAGNARIRPSSQRTRQDVAGHLPVPPVQQNFVSIDL